MTTAQDIINQIRLVTNTENSQFVTDNELLYYVNASAGELDDLLVAKQQDYRLTTAIITIANTNLIPLPADFYQLRQVDFYYAPSQALPWATLEKFMLKEQTMYSNSLTRNMYGIPNLKYMLQDGYIAIVPETVASGQYRVWYTPVMNTMALTDNIPSFFDNNAWREYMVMDCSIKVYNKQQKDPMIFNDRLNKLKTRIQSMAGSRDSGSPAHVVNTTSSAYNSGIGGFGYGSGGF